jgi:hypothetical protein
LGLASGDEGLQLGDLGLLGADHALGEGPHLWIAAVLQHHLGHVHCALVVGNHAAREIQVRIPAEGDVSATLWLDTKGLRRAVAQLSLRTREQHRKKREIISLDQALKLGAICLRIRLLVSSRR